MTVFILRHGQAEAQLTTDEARRLTGKGHSDTARIVGARVAEMASVTQIWASPLVRAQQTAAIAADYFPAIEIQTTGLLVPDADPHALIEWLAEIVTGNQSVLVVSHQPLVGGLVNTLCNQPRDYYPMGTSSLAAISAPEIVVGAGHLLWLDHA